MLPLEPLCLVMRPMPPDAAGPSGFGPTTTPAHRDRVTACPCQDCVRDRGVGTMLRNQSETVRFILYLKWLKWVLRNRDRKDWPAVSKAPEGMGL